MEILFQIVGGKGVNAKHCWMFSTNFWIQKVCWQYPAMFCLYTFFFHNLNFHWRWRSWDWIQAIFLNLFLLYADYSWFYYTSCTYNYIHTYFSSQFPPNATKPDMVLGTHMQPGSDHTHFCMPTAVAVAASGDFFVADGYCNSRVMKFNKDGKLIKIISMYHSPHSFTNM